MTRKTQLLFAEMEDFYTRMQMGEYNYPASFAVAIQKIADKAWDMVDEIYSPATQIKP